ncbi:MAG: hypothetical protein ACRETL_05040, partial [Gammaproteobacteria bacterium]
MAIRLVRYASFVICAGLVAVAASSALLLHVAHAEGDEKGPNEYTTKAKAAIVMDADSGATIYQV